MQTIRLADFSTSSEVLIGSVVFDAPSCLVHTNFLRLNPDLGRRHLETLYVTKTQTIPDIRLHRLPHGTLLAVHTDEDFIAYLDDRVLADQIRPYWQANDVKTAIERDAKPVYILEEALLSARFGLRTWGHWLSELLPKIVCTETAYPGRFRYIVPKTILSDTNLRTIGQSLDAYGIGGDRLIFVDGGSTYQFANLFAVSPIIVPHCAIHPLAVALMRRIVPEVSGSEISPGRVAFLRRESSTRNITNVDEVCSYLQADDWGLVDIGTLDFTEQVRLLASSTSIISVLGSGLTGLIYAPQKIDVITLAPSNWSDLFFFSIMQERRVRLADVRGISVASKTSDARVHPFELDVSALQEALNALGLSTGPAVRHQMRLGGSTGDKTEMGTGSEADSAADKSKYFKQVNLEQPLDHKGISYLDFFAVLNHELKPRTYFEIGTERGQSVRRFSCDAICIDPHFQINEDVIGGRRRTFMFQMRSRDFFAEHDIRNFFPDGIEIAFQDGLHHFEALLQDFIDTERFCHSKSLMVLHDCLPLNERMAERDYRLDETEDPLTRGHWTGDVWRIIPILQKFRPELHIFFVDCPPTGLVLCSNLNRYSTVLSDNHDQIVNQFRELSLSVWGLYTLWRAFPMLDSTAIAREPQLLPVLLGLG